MATRNTEELLPLSQYTCDDPPHSAASLSLSFSLTLLSICLSRLFFSGMHLYVFLRVMVGVGYGGCVAAGGVHE